MSGFIIYIVVSIFTPGPNNIFASISSSKSGFKKTIPFMFGILIGTSMIFIISSFFNVLLYENIDALFTVIGMLGGCFILYLSYVMIRDVGKQEQLMIKGDKLFILAIFLNFINPKTVIFGITVATYYIEVGLDTAYIYYFSLLMGVICFISVIVWGLLGELFSELLKKHNKGFNIVMAVLLAYSGLLIIAEALM